VKRAGDAAGRRRPFRHRVEKYSRLSENVTNDDRRCFLETTSARWSASPRGDATASLTDRRVTSARPMDGPRAGRPRERRFVSSSRSPARPVGSSAAFPRSERTPARAPGSPRAFPLGAHPARVRDGSRQGEGQGEGRGGRRRGRRRGRRLRNRRRGDGGGAEVRARRGRRGVVRRRNRRGLGQGRRLRRHLRRLRRGREGARVPRERFPERRRRGAGFSEPRRGTNARPERGERPEDVSHAPELFFSSRGRFVNNRRRYLYKPPHKPTPPHPLTRKPQGAEALDVNKDGKVDAADASAATEALRKRCAPAKCVVM